MEIVFAGIVPEKVATLDLKGLFAIAAGVFSICGALFNWNWFMTHRKAAFMVRILGRSGARIFYGALGVLLVILGGVATFAI